MKPPLAVESNEHSVSQLVATQRIRMKNAQPRMRHLDHALSPRVQGSSWKRGWKEPKR